MGKNTDKLYITHSEWGSSDRHTAGGGAPGSNISYNRPPPRKPFTHCSLSLTPFNDPVIDSNGNIYDKTRILKWLEKHDTNPVTGEKLNKSDLIELNIFKNSDGEYSDPVTMKVFTDSSSIVALRNTGNVFLYDTIKTLNIKSKNWFDLVTNEKFNKSDIITIQGSKNDENFGKSINKDNDTGNLNQVLNKDTSETISGINLNAIGSAAKIIAAKKAIEKARQNKNNIIEPLKVKDNSTKINEKIKTEKSFQTDSKKVNSHSYNTASYSTGRAAMSLTSTYATVHTSTELDTITDEEYLLKPKRIKSNAYLQMSTNLGNLNIELWPEFSPKTVYNFIKLAKAHYYDGVIFHRNIRHFMIQGGDPTGTGRGGRSFWGKDFADELNSPYTHDSRGILSMANKGKNTNSSQFFILYREAKHLDKKHTIFGKVVGGLDILEKMEMSPVDQSDKPLEEIKIKKISVFTDPFEDTLEQLKSQKVKDNLDDNSMPENNKVEDNESLFSWSENNTQGTYKKNSSSIKNGDNTVGKYLKRLPSNLDDKSGDEQIESNNYKPINHKRVKKKLNFDCW